MSFLGRRTFFLGRRISFNFLVEECLSLEGKCLSGLGNVVSW